MPSIVPDDCCNLARLRRAVSAFGVAGEIERALPVNMLWRARIRRIVPLPRSCFHPRLYPADSRHFGRGTPRLVSDRRTLWMRTVAVSHAARETRHQRMLIARSSGSRLCADRGAPQPNSSDRGAISNNEETNDGFRSATGQSEPVRCRIQSVAYFNKLACTCRSTPERRRDGGSQSCIVAPCSVVNLRGQVNGALFWLSRTGAVADLQGSCAPATAGGSKAGNSACAPATRFNRQWKNQTKSTTTRGPCRGRGGSSRP